MQDFLKEWWGGGLGGCSKASYVKPQKPHQATYYFKFVWSYKKVMKGENDNNPSQSKRKRRLFEVFTYFT